MWVEENMGTLRGPRIGKKDVHRILRRFADPVRGQERSPVSADIVGGAEGRQDRLPVRAGPPPGHGAHEERLPHGHLQVEFNNTFSHNLSIYVIILMIILFS